MSPDLDHTAVISPSGAVVKRFDIRTWSPPTWTTNGQGLLLAVSDHGEQMAERLDLATGTETPLVQNAFAPAASSDGAHLAFLRTASDGPLSQLWVGDSIGRHAHLVTGQPVDSYAWSPVSPKLAVITPENVTSSAEG